jgi:AraC family transcriptional regulator, regulatory protein of adaptative response / DNA-3-methyladenine glycosylase II
MSGVTTYSAVATTGIYCRPGCGAKPLAENVRTFELAAAAEAAGYRACLRCRPYRVAGPVGSDAPELVCRAVRLILDGALDGGTEAELGARLAVSSRHLRRLFQEHVGVTPDQLARSRRAHFARRMLDDSDLTVTDVAFTAGFGSLRQFNREMRGVFKAAPAELRQRRHRSDRLAADGGLTMRLPFQPPLDWEATIGFLADHAVPGVESVADGVYRRTISLDNGPGLLEIQAGGVDYLLLRAHLPYWEGLIHVAERAARIVGTDTDVGVAERYLGEDAMLRGLIATRPGLRVPGAWGPLEVAVHAIVLQSCDLDSAKELLGELISCAGQAFPGLTHGLTHLFPSAEILATTDLRPTALRAETANTIRTLAAAVASGRLILDGAAPLEEFVADMLAVEGVTETTAHRVALRLGYRDAYPEADPDVRAALDELDARRQGPMNGWRPWRALGATHLAAQATSRR